MNRIGIFIDGANVNNMLASLGRRPIDYTLLLEHFRERGRLIRAYYFAAHLADGQADSGRKLLDYLSYNGFTLVTKPCKEFRDAQGGLLNRKGNLDVEIAVYAMEMAKHLDEVVLFSGDGDFRMLVESLQRQGVRVAVLSTRQTKPSYIADELRRQADEFIEVAELPIFKPALVSEAAE